MASAAPIDTASATAEPAVAVAAAPSTATLAAPYTDGQTTEVPTTETLAAPSTKTVGGQATETPDSVSTEPAAPMSKSQQKKLARKLRHEETRPAWKAAKKEKAKARKERKREEAALKRKSPDDEADADADADAEAKRVKKSHNVPRKIEDITLIMDCGFDEMMTDKVCTVAPRLERETVLTRRRKSCQCPRSSRGATRPTGHRLSSSRCTSRVSTSACLRATRA